MAVTRQFDVRLDPFQTRALDVLDEGGSVLVMAPTGAGKTLVADHAVAGAVAEETTAVYTTPLKALSNQKYRDLRHRLGADRVGLITGDRVVNPAAPVLVMTTEVLRAMLYDRAFEQAGRRPLGVVVLDEFHYLQDPERGSAWEEVIIHLPPRVRLVCLSATIPDVETVHRWLEKVHGPTGLVVAADRPVTLNHLYAVGNLRGAPPLLLPVRLDGRVNRAAELLDGDRRATRGEGRRVRDRDRPVTPERKDLIEQLAVSGLLPAIWFVLSRAGCDEAVAGCVADGVRLTSESQAYRLRELVRSALAQLDAGELRAIEVTGWQRGLEAGVAAHHGGLAPVQREVVETAFAEGLVQITFATETLALGVNLPARTVVLDRVLRAGGTLLSAAEFAQLAGRAGRRGIDETGDVVVPWSPHVSFQRVADLVGGQLASIRSRFRVTPAMAANLVHAGSPADARTAAESSLRHALELDRSGALRADLGARTVELALLHTEAVGGTAAAADPASDQASDPAFDPADGNADDVADNGTRRGQVAACLAGVRPGDVLLDPSRPDAEPVVVLQVGRSRGQPSAEAVRTDARRVRLTPRTVRVCPLVVGRIELPTWVPTERGHARRAADALADFDLPAVPVAVPTGRSTGRSSGRPVAARPRRGDRAAHRAQLTRSIARLEDLVEEAEGGVGRELDAVVRVLERRGHVLDTPTGWSLAPSGQVVRHLFHPSGLLLAECLGGGLLDGLDPPSLASAASWFTTRARAGGPRSTGFATPQLARTFELVREVTRSVVADEIELGAPPTPHPEPALGVPVYRWASGAALDAALVGCDVPVGDLVREARQVAELLEQVLAVPGAHPVGLAAAVPALRRGAVVAETW